MNVYHLNCGTLHPYYPRFTAVIYCLLLELEEGLILIDTGIGQEDYLDPSPKMRLFKMMVGVSGDVDEAAARQIEAMGYTPHDVKDIVLTHLHLDHAGGLPDFPCARVHIYGKEYEAGMNRLGLMSWAYDARHWAHGPDWVIHDRPEEDWFGFPSLRIWEDREPEIRLIPLPGHTRGHCAVAIQDEDGWLLHCGDAASPYHPASDVFDVGRENYLMSWLPAGFVGWFHGHHAPKLRRLLEEHADKIKAFSAHDVFSLAENRKRKS